MKITKQYLKFLVEQQLKEVDVLEPQGHPAGELGADPAAEKEEEHVTGLLREISLFKEDLTAGIKKADNVSTSEELKELVRNLREHLRMYIQDEADDSFSQSAEQ